jgi:hypothetical protein
MTTIKTSKDEVLASLRANKSLDASPLEEVYILLLMQLGEFEGWWIPGNEAMSFEDAIRCIVKMRLENDGSATSTILSNLRFSYNRTF